MNPRKIPSSIIFGFLGYFIVNQYCNNIYSKEIDKIICLKYGIPTTKKIRLNPELVELGINEEEVKNLKLSILGMKNKETLAFYSYL